MKFLCYENLEPYGNDLIFDFVSSFTKYSSFPCDKHHITLCGNEKILAD